jgi:hypothetical protein
MWSLISLQMSEMKKARLTIVVLFLPPSEQGEAQAEWVRGSIETSKISSGAGWSYKRKRNYQGATCKKEETEVNELFAFRSYQ